MMSSSDIVNYRPQYQQSLGYNQSSQPFPSHWNELFGMPPSLPGHEYTHSPYGPLPLSYDWTMYMYNRLRIIIDKPPFKTPRGVDPKTYVPPPIKEHVDFEMDCEQFYNTRFGSYRLKPDNPKRPMRSLPAPQNKELNGKFFI